MSEPTVSGEHNSLEKVLKLMSSHQLAPGTYMQQWASENLGITAEEFNLIGLAVREMHSRYCSGRRLRNDGPWQISNTGLPNAGSMCEPQLAERWEALVKFDDDIAKAADTLRPFGDQWIAELGRGYFALGEDKRYLPNIVQKLVSEAKQEEERLCVAAEEAEERLWAARFAETYDGEPCSLAGLAILRRAEAEGYILSVQIDRTILATKGQSTSYLRSNSEIQRFGEYM